VKLNSVELFVCFRALELKLRAAQLTLTDIILECERKQGERS